MQHLNNGLPQGSALVPILFNQYVSYMPLFQSAKFGYVDDLALVDRTKTIEEASSILSEDLCVL